VRTAQEFLDGLRDSREVFYRGERVDSVVDHPELGIAARHAALDFSFADDNPDSRSRTATRPTTTYHERETTYADARR